MNECFQQLGKRLFRNEILKSIVKDGAMLAAVPFSIRMFYRISDNIASYWIIYRSASIKQSQEI